MSYSSQSKTWFLNANACPKSRWLCPSSLPFDAGAGKTLFLQVLAGTVPGYQGKITYNGEHLCPETINSLFGWGMASTGTWP
jgi:hypothetical protein